MKTSRQAFTLIEMLVVIAIIALLVSITVPTISRALNSARQTQSLSNLRQIFIGFTGYSLENRERWPAPRARWSNAIQGYITNATGNAADEALLRSIFTSPGWNTPEVLRAYPNAATEPWRQGYGMNVMLPDNLTLGQRYSTGADQEKYPGRIIAPSQTLLLVDSMNALAMPHSGNTTMYDLASTRYRGTLTALFCDGHTSVIPWSPPDELFMNTSTPERKRFWGGEE